MTPRSAALRASWRRFDWWLTPLLVFLITRSAITAAGYLGRVALRDAVGYGPWHTHSHNLLLDIWDRWDASYYRNIARNGYVYAPPDDPGNVAFFPLYPLLIRAGTAVLGNPTLAGVLISHLSLLGALIVLYRLAQLEFGDRPLARRAIIYLSIFPTAFYFGAVYTESTFLLCAVTAVYAARRRVWLPAGIAAMLAAVTRLNGSVLYLFLLIEWATECRERLAPDDGRTGAAAWLTAVWCGLRERRVLGNLLAVQISWLGLLAFMWHLHTRVGDPLAFYRAHAWWGRSEIGWPLSGLWRDFSAIFRQNWLAGDAYMWRVTLDAAIGVAFLLLATAVWRRLNANYALYTALGILVPTASGSTMSLSRYAAVIFPAFLILAVWGRNAWVDRALTVVFCVLLAVLFTVFVNWGFVG